MANERKGRGRPSTFTDDLGEIICRLAEAGRTDDQIAEIVGVSRKTLGIWRNRYRDFGIAMRASKAVADDLVEMALFRRAVGCTVTETKVFFDSKNGSVVEHELVKHLPPDVGAAILWLCNRRPDRWRRGQKDQASELPVQEIRLAYSLDRAPAPSLTAEASSSG